MLPQPEQLVSATPNPNSKALGEIGVAGEPGLEAGAAEVTSLSAAGGRFQAPSDFLALPGKESDGAARAAITEGSGFGDGCTSEPPPPFLTTCWSSPSIRKSDCSRVLTREARCSSAAGEAETRGGAVTGERASLLAAAAVVGEPSPKLGAYDEGTSSREPGPLAGGDWGWGQVRGSAGLDSTQLVTCLCNLFIRSSNEKLVRVCLGLGMLPPASRMRAAADAATASSVSLGSSLSTPGQIQLGGDSASRFAGETGSETRASGRSLVSIFLLAGLTGDGPDAGS